MSTATAVKIPTGEQGNTLTAGELRAWRGLLRAHACLARSSPAVRVFPCSPVGILTAVAVDMAV